MRIVGSWARSVPMPGRWQQQSMQAAVRIQQWCTISFIRMFHVLVGKCRYGLPLHLTRKCEQQGFLFLALPSAYWLVRRHINQSVHLHHIVQMSNSEDAGQNTYFQVYGASYSYFKPMALAWMQVQWLCCLCDHPYCPAEVVTQEGWSLITGDIYTKM